MDTLPIELFALILNELTYDERINCVAVCKTFRNAIRSLRLKSLIVCDRFEGLQTQRWFDTNAPICRRNILSNCKFNRLLCESSAQVLSNVRELAVYNLSRKNGSSNFETVCNSLVTVERLDLYDIKELNALTRLQMASLEVLCIDCVLGDLQIDAGRLKKVKYFLHELDGVHDLKFVRPESLEEAEFDDVKDCLATFVNLKVLYLENIHGLEHNFLGNFKNLAEIQFARYRGLDDVRSLEEQRRRFKLNHLAISYLGLRLDNSRQFSKIFADYDALEPFNESQIRFFSQNFSRLSDRLPFINELNFNEIENVFPSLSRAFYARLTNLVTVSLDRALNHANETQFGEFLKLCRFPSLDLRNCRLTADFLARLPVSCWFIQTLILGRNVFAGEPNLEFVFGLKFLNTLRIEQEISRPFVRRIYSELKYLQSFFFRCDLIWHSILHLEEENEIQLSKLSTKYSFGQMNDLLAFLEYA